MKGESYRERQAGKDMAGACRCLFQGFIPVKRSRGSSVSTVSVYGLDDRAIGFRSKGFVL
jgi:hypothetical protein